MKGVETCIIAEKDGKTEPNVGDKACTLTDDLTEGMYEKTVAIHLGPHDDAYAGGYASPDDGSTDTTTDEKDEVNYESARMA